MTSEIIYHQFCNVPLVTETNRNTLREVITPDVRTGSWDHWGGEAAYHDSFKRENKFNKAPVLYKLFILLELAKTGNYVETPLT